MIITRSPLRISLGGGGTDLPSYYKKHEGFLIAATINQYVYTSINENFRSEILLKYSSIEKVSNINMVKHPIIRECLKKTKLEKKNLEISSMADIPAGTGLGSFLKLVLKQKNPGTSGFLSNSYSSHICPV